MRRNPLLSQVLFDLLRSRLMILEPFLSRNPLLSQVLFDYIQMKMVIIIILLS